MTTELEQLYQAMYATDAVFTAAVIRQFGRHKSGDARYHERAFNPETRQKAEAFWKACNAYLDAKRDARENGGDR